MISARTKTALRPKRRGVAPSWRPAVVRRSMLGNAPRTSGINCNRPMRKTVVTRNCLRKNLAGANGSPSFSCSLSARAGSRAPPFGYSCQPQSECKFFWTTCRRHRSGLHFLLARRPPRTSLSLDLPLLSRLRIIHPKESVFESIFHIGT